MFNPPHPGLTLRDDVLPALDLQFTEAASQLGIDRTTLSKVLDGRAAISPTMALRIERWLGRDHGGAAEVWLAQQSAYDLWQARRLAKKAARKSATSNPDRYRFEKHHQN
jgi:addiction module HigA family antidote